jgi:hypothetical protein
MFKLAVIALVLSWVALFLSSSAILVWSETVPPKKAGDQTSLTCSYFTGPGIIEQSFWYHANGGFWGVSACPRLVKL